MISSVPVSLRDAAQLLVVPRLRQHDADVGQRRLGQHRRHVARLERSPQRVDVVELDHLRRLHRIDGRAHVPGPRPRHAVVQPDHRLVDRAVVAPVEHQHLRPPRQRARDPQHPSVGVGRGQRELPGIQPEPPHQLPAHPGRILGRHHPGRPPPDLALDRARRRLRGVARHRAGVAQAEIDEPVTVHVGDGGAASLGHEQREPARPHRHPAHRNPAQQRLRGLGVQLARPRMLLREAGPLAFQQPPQPGAIDLHVGGRTHSATLPQLQHGMQRRSEISRPSRSDSSSSSCSLKWSVNMRPMSS